jgi:hypothetical protein
MKDPKTRYYLEPKHKDINKRTEPEMIMVEIGYGYLEYTSKGNRYKPFRLALESRVVPSQFGLKEEGYKYNRKVFEKSQKSNATIKTKMLKIEKALNELANTYEIQSVIPKPNEFKNDLKIKLDRVKVKQVAEVSILDFLYKKIELDKVDSGKGKKSSLSINTIKTYTTISHLIENYQLATNDVLMFSTLDKGKYWKVWDVLDEILMGKISVDNPKQTRKQRKQEYGYLVNTLRKYQGALIRTLKDADKEGFKTPMNIFDDDFVLDKVESAKDIFLSIDDLLLIINADVKFDDGLQAAKDYIVVGSLTGMRYESMRHASGVLVQSCTNEKYDFKYIHSIQNKTSTEVCIPLLSPILDVLGDKNKLPMVKSNPETNAKLKQLFKYLKFDRLEDVTKVTYSNGTIKTKEPLYNLITTHDCKKTFYTNLVLGNARENVIDNITHPDKTPKNAMGKVYNKSTMLDKSKLFVDEINRINTTLYKF